MTNMRWIRLDTGFPMNPKILELVGARQHRAIAVYVCGLAYAGAQGSEGWLPFAALSHIHGRKTDAEMLCKVGLWMKRPHGWEIHDWLDYQPTNETMTLRTERAKAAALTRWHSNGQGA